MTPYMQKHFGEGRHSSNQVFYRSDPRRRDRTACAALARFPDLSRSLHGRHCVLLNPVCPLPAAAGAGAQGAWFVMMVGDVIVVIVVAVAVTLVCILHVTRTSAFFVHCPDILIPHLLVPQVVQSGLTKATQVHGARWIGSHMRMVVMRSRSVQEYSQHIPSFIFSQQEERTMVNVGGKG